MLTELQDEPSSDIMVSEAACPQEAVGACPQDVTFVVGEVFFGKCAHSGHDARLFTVHTVNMFL